MPRCVILSLAALLAAAGAQSANAQAMTGAFMVQGCDDDATKDSCMIYLRGLYEGFLAGQQLYPYGAIACPQPNVSPYQLRLLALRAARENPKMLNDVPSGIMSKAILDAFRCRPGQTPNYNQ